MLVEIQAGLAGAKAAIDIAKGIHSLGNETERNAAVIEIQRHVLEAQQGLSAAYADLRQAEEAISDLKARLERREKDRAEIATYRWAKFHPGTTVLVSPENGQPSHFLCVNCGNSAIRSVLQPTGAVERRYRIYRCEGCKSEIPIGTPTDEPDNAVAPRPPVINDDGLGPNS